MASLSFDRVYKLFGTTPVLEEFTLQVPDGEFLVLVGPSGCGKTTTLRILAGLERATYGTVSIGSRVVNRVPPKDRDIAMVFQSYALYPHMSVARNLSFGLRIRRVPKRTIEEQVKQVADTLGLAELLDRRPAELSGGQRQRVAVGRAMLRRPQVFLMDEPLSNLDAALRGTMRAELSLLHRQLGVTNVYVTHDQVEAMTMGTQIVVMDTGRIQQTDKPEVIHGTPANLFVATFIGSPRMNLLPGALGDNGSVVNLKYVDHPIRLEGEIKLAAQRSKLRSVIVGIRPEDVRWKEDAPASCTERLVGTVEIVEPLGSETYVTVRARDRILMARFPPRSAISVGQEVELVFNPTHLHVFDSESGRNVLMPDAPATSPGRWFSEDQAAVAHTAEALAAHTKTDVPSAVGTDDPAASLGTSVTTN